MTNYSDVVQRIHDEKPPAKTLEGALDFLLRVCHELPETGAGLLAKPGGENIVNYDGRMVSASRICFPDGHIVKVLTDVPTTNGPSWQDTGEMVDTNRYIQVPFVVVVPDPPVVLPPPVDTGVQQLAEKVDAALLALDALAKQSDANTEKIQQQINQVVKDAEATATRYLPGLERLSHLLFRDTRKA